MRKVKKIIVNKEKNSVRNDWIPTFWRYNGAGFQKDKKKLIPRKQKYKKSVLDY